MGKPTGFLEFTRELPNKRSVQERKNDYKEFVNPYREEQLNQQAARCMDCGVPFCHHGCPLGNVIPEFNDAVYRKHWQEAYEILSSTNNFPEFTGRTERQRQSELHHSGQHERGFSGCRSILR